MKQPSTDLVFVRALFRIQPGKSEERLFRLSARKYLAKGYALADEETARLASIVWKYRDRLLKKEILTPGQIAIAAIKAGGVTAE